MSPLLGMPQPRTPCPPSSRELQEAVEEVAGVVWPRAKRRVVLDGAAGDVLEDEDLDGPVVEIEVGELGSPKSVSQRTGSSHRSSRRHRTLDGEAVILGGDVDPARLEVLDRVIRAAVAEGT